MEGLRWLPGHDAAPLHTRKLSLETICYSRIECTAAFTRSLTSRRSGSKPHRSGRTSATASA
eukprot:1772236-Prymnesium_polylepis.1